MSTLSISLVALVLVVVVGVLLFNFWQSRGGDRQRAVFGAGGRSGSGRRTRDELAAAEPDEEGDDRGIAGSVRAMTARRRQASASISSAFILRLIGPIWAVPAINAGGAVEEPLPSISFVTLG